MSYYNYQNFNMMNTGWGGLLQQGLGMLGGNSYGMMGMGGSIWGGNNFFTNCFGEPNYDAMAGFGVANVLTGVLGQAISSIRAQKAEAKQAEIDTEARLEEVKKEIKELEDTDYEKAIDSKYDANIKDAERRKNDIEKIEPDKRTDEQTRELAKLKGGVGVDGSIDDLKNKKNAAIEAKKKEINEKITELNTEKAKLEEQVTNTKLAKAQGKKYQATKQEDFYAKWVNGEPKAGTEFTSGDMKFAIGQLSKAVGDDDKKAWAKKIDTIYSYFLNNDKKSITSDFKFAAQTAQKYLG